MITKLKIVKIGKEHDNLENIDFINVFVDFFDEEDVGVDNRAYRFPLEATEEEITAELEKTLATMMSDEKMKIENSEIDAINKQADEVVEALQDKEIVAPDDVPEEGGPSGGASDEVMS